MYSNEFVFAQVGQQYNAVLQNGTVPQLNSSLMQPHQQNRFYYSDQNETIQPPSDAIFQSNTENSALSPVLQVQKHSVQPNDSIKTQTQNPQPLQPSVQINIQPLIKPMQPTRTHNIQSVAPIVYSFGQTDYSNKVFPKASNFLNMNRPTMHRKVSWGKGDTLDIEDDFADILG